MVNEVYVMVNEGYVVVNEVIMYAVNEGYLVKEVYALANKN